MTGVRRPRPSKTTTVAPADPAGACRPVRAQRAAWLYYSIPQALAFVYYQLPG